MKYARIVYNDLNKKNTEYTNVGDWIQTFAVDELYKAIGIKSEDIIEINRSELAEYSGEKCIVIMQGWFNQLDKKDFFPLSKNLLPVYIGFHRLNVSNFNESKETLIGCRDESTYEILKKNGNNVYLSGCLTLTLPKRKKMSCQKETFFVDVPEKLFEYVPKEIMKNSHKITHEILNRRNPEKDSKDLLKMYYERAALVVTSRLHCASPCIAMGIPVILVRNYFDDRYGWIDKYVKLYTPDLFNQIDWEPKVIELEEKKAMLKEIFAGQVFGQNIEEKCKELTQFYLVREKTKLRVPLLTKAYWSLQKINPKLAQYLRINILGKFTVIGANAENEEI